MKHQIRALLLVTAGFFAVLFTIWAVDRAVVQPAFNQLQRAQALEDAARARAAIQSELRQLDHRVGDWAQWDDSYAFAEERNPAFIQSNFSEWSVMEHSSQLNFAVVFARDGRILYRGGYDSDLGGEITLAVFTDPPPPIRLLFQTVLDTGQSRGGLLHTEHGLLLLVAQPILTTAGTGPPSGTLALGRFLDDPLLQKLVEQTHVAFTVFPMGDPRLTPEEAALFSSLPPAAPVIRAETSGLLQPGYVYETVPGLTGPPVALLRTPVRQDIAMIARNTRWILIATLGLIALALLLGRAWLLARSDRAGIKTPTTAWGNAALVVLIGLSLTIGLQWRLQEQQLIEPENVSIFLLGSLSTLLLALYLFALISQRQRADALVAARTAQLQASERQFRSIVENAPFGFHFYRLTEDDRLILSGANPAADTLLKRLHTDDLGHGLQEIFPTLGSTEIPAAYRHLARHGGMRHWEQVDYHDHRIGGIFEVTAFQTAPGAIAIAFADITQRKRAEAAIASRIIALTRPLDEQDSIKFEDMFNLADLQNLQDLFAQATGVASIITHPDGTPITRPSNFRRLCQNLIRCSAQGLKNCYQSDAVIGRHHPDGPIIQPCLSGGLWDAGASITIGGRHIANWLIGQVRDETQSEPRMLEYARNIGVDEQIFLAAFREVPMMSREQFERIAQTLFALSKQLSTLAYQNIQQARFITEQKETEQRIEHLAYYDALTDLPNRTLLIQRAELALALAARRRSEMAILFMDLDRFKEVNDSLGHSEGDTLLVQVATRLREQIRETDTVCRLGGDEFVLLLPDTDPEGALLVADKVLLAFCQPFLLAGHHLRVTTSIGIALYPHDGQTVTELLKNADAALYQAKQDGRNTRAFYAREMNVATFERLMLETELRKAIAAGQLRAYYQAKVRLSDGQVIGAEALVRWLHPDHVLITPGRFIPLAEASDLIVEIGDWMLEEVCRQLAIWRDAGLLPLTVAVNLAARHFRDKGLAARIEGLLAAHQLPSQALELELTESSLLITGPQTAETLLALQRLGVGLAIDDFGTGYSSLSYLKRLPLTALKIDQSFVRDLVTDADDRILAATIVALGHSLGLKIVAEGVETDEQRRILLEQGCDLAQGYWFGRPIPAEEFIAGLTR